ncbi:MAG: transcription antitermination factor NusB [Bacillota bacterium]
MSRRLAREAAFKALFQIDIGKCRVEQALHYTLPDHDLNNDEKIFVEDLVSNTAARQDSLDRLIQKYLVKWELKRLSAVDRNLLRLALYEILHREDIPNAVAINEALELAKKYGSTAEAVGFINGVLDRAIGEAFEKGS